MKLKTIGYLTTTAIIGISSACSAFSNKQTPTIYDVMASYQKVEENAKKNALNNTIENVGKYTTTTSIRKRLEKIAFLNSGGEIEKIISPILSYESSGFVMSKVKYKFGPVKIKEIEKIMKKADCNKDRFVTPDEASTFLEDSYKKFKQKKSNLGEQEWETLKGSEIIKLEEGLTN